jgi:hypothetical protein
MQAWPYVYEWDCESFRRTDKLGTNTPVPENTVLFDLLNGDMDVVEEVSVASPPDFPKPIIRTRSVGRLRPDQLIKLRAEADYAPTDLSLPLDDITFFSDLTKMRAFLSQ